jgi:hypothetical protein
MTAPTISVFEGARAIANTVLYEGYVLYPYRASSSKNQTRWQFGVLMPPGYVTPDNGERSACRTQVVVEAPPDAHLTVAVRFLHVAHRTGGERPDWDETVEREVEVAATVAALLADSREHQFAFAGEDYQRDGARLLSQGITGTLRISIEPLPGPYGALRLNVEVANTTLGADYVDRDGAVQGALVAAHTLCALDVGHFVSMTDPPEWAKPFVERCVNEGVWPVLAGPGATGDRVLLSSPIILGDHPEIAPESPGDLYDSTEIDEILTLRTMTLTDSEKAEARATDPRAAAVIDRVDGLPQEQLDRLHGALRYLRHVTGDDISHDTGDVIFNDGTGVAPGGPAMEEEIPTYFVPDAPWWNPGADSSVDPESDAVQIDGITVARGTRVRLFPGRGQGARRSDAQDDFLRGRTAIVEVVMLDVDGGTHIGVTPDDDPELAEITRWHGRYLYFTPVELEPVHADWVQEET